MRPRHAENCPRRLDTNATCVCAFLRPRLERLRVDIERAVQLWGEERIRLLVKVGLLEPTADAGYLVLSAELAEEARQRNGREG